MTVIQWWNKFDLFVFAYDFLVVIFPFYLLGITCFIYIAIDFSCIILIKCQLNVHTMTASRWNNTDNRGVSCLLSASGNTQAIIITRWEYGQHGLEEEENNNPGPPALTVYENVVFFFVVLIHAQLVQCILSLLFCRCHIITRAA